MWLSAMYRILNIQSNRKLKICFFPLRKYKFFRHSQILCSVNKIIYLKLTKIFNVLIKFILTISLLLLLLLVVVVVVVVVVFYSFRGFPFSVSWLIFPWSLGESKRPQVSRTLINILVNLRNAVVWMVSTITLIFHCPVGWGL